MRCALLLFLSALLVGGCAPVGRDDKEDERCAVRIDEDGDGYAGTNSTLVDCGKEGTEPPRGDCDDANDAVHPGGEEVCGGLDEDCDGLVDDDDPDLPASYADADGDGFGDPESVGPGCADSTRVADGTDCDDGEVDVHPGADEICDGGTDEDCDGLADADDPSVTVDATWYADADGDGYGALAESQTGCAQPSGFVRQPGDCDEGNPAVNPGVDEVCGNGLDDNCDRTSSGCGLSGESGFGDAHWCATTEGRFLGSGIAAMEDLDGDGRGELVVTGDRGEAYVYLGGGTGRDPTWDAALYISADSVLRAADLDGDGSDDLVAGTLSYSDGSAEWSGRIQLFTAPLTEERDAAVEWTSDVAGLNVGETIALGDWNGDGMTDMFFGIESNFVLGTFGPFEPGSYPVESVPFLGEGPQYLMPSISMGDTDGDGLDDLAVGYDSNTNGNGIALVATGGWDGHERLEDVADAYMVQDVSGGVRFGISVELGGDQNGDGYADLLVSGESSSGVGYVSVFHGPVDRMGDATGYGAKLRATEEDTRFGIVMSYVGDENGDGHDDILIGEPYATTDYFEEGAAWLWHGPLSSGTTDTADAGWLGEVDRGWVGSRVGSAGDWNGDGIGDLFIGQWSLDESPEVCVVLGGDL